MSGVVPRARQACRACRRAIDGLVAVLVAPPCATCGEPLASPLDGAVCESCWREIASMAPDVAGGPGLPRGVTHARAIGAYEGRLRQAVHALKYDGRRSLARGLGALMRRQAHDALDAADLVVPVPLHPSRRRRRGFNQASDLAAHLERPVTHALRRVRRTATQADLPAAARAGNVRGAFARVRGVEGRLDGSRVALVDDVWTTGATLAACAGALREAGASEVIAVTAARAALRRPP